MKVLCTGGCGYIGSHTVIQLIEQGHEVTILDNFCNADSKIIARLEQIVGKKIDCVQADLTDIIKVNELFNSKSFDAVIHYAGLKAVGESVAFPLKYYSVNLFSTLNLLEAMQKHSCKVLVFSSSATVYAPLAGPIPESAPIKASNPYGQTKVMIEQILQDLFVSDPSWRISILRYFNPVGAHPSGSIGESPSVPNNLLPFIQQVAVGRQPALNVFGNDWDTIDGTGVRDYLHVEDLAAGHIAAMSKLFKNSNGACITHNLGTGKGFSVLELVSLFEETTGVKIPVEIQPRRKGDLAYVVADVSKAKADLDWEATRTIRDACASAYNWQMKNPFGYEKSCD